MSLLRPEIQDDRGARVESVIPWKKMRYPVFVMLVVFVSLNFGFVVVPVPRLRPMLAAGFTLLALQVLWGIRGEPARALAANRVARACPACLYELKSLAPEPDGCTVCPECGAAWRLEEGTEARSHEGTEE